MLNWFGVVRGANKLREGRFGGASEQHERSRLAAHL